MESFEFNGWELLALPSGEGLKSFFPQYVDTGLEAFLAYDEWTIYGPVRNDELQAYPLLQEISDKYFLKREWTSVLKLFKAPSGQLKNLFVAIETVLQLDIREVCLIGLIGSKASAGSGVWHNFFEMWLLTRGFVGTVEYYDGGEIDNVEVKGPIRSVHHSTYYEGDGEEFDVLIDDVWAFDSPGTMKWRSHSWSQKAHGGVPFFHKTEGRSFSHVRRSIPLESKGCNCPRCLFEESSVDSAYLEWFRALTNMIEEHPCVSVRDSVHVHEVYNTLLASGEYRVMRPVESRTALHMRPLFPLVTHSNLYKVAAQEDIVVDYHGMPEGTELDMANYFSKKSVTYVGVDPSTLGIVGAKKPVGGNLYYAKSVDIAFLSNLSMLQEVVNAKEIFFKGSVLAGYRATGRVWKEFFSYMPAYDSFKGYKAKIAVDYRDMVSLYVQGEFKEQIAKGDPLNFIGRRYGLELQGYAISDIKLAPGSHVVHRDKG